jgi:hypothetical protein
VGYNLTVGRKPEEVNAKLAGRAASTGLLGDMDLGDVYTETDSIVYMVAR